MYKEAGATRATSDCFKLISKTAEGDQEEEATTSCNLWLLLKRLAWILQ